MKKMSVLVRMQLGSVLSFLKISYAKNKQESRKNASTMTIIGAAFLLFMVISFAYNFGYANVLNMYGSLDLLPGLMLTFASMITLITTIYKVRGTVFGFGDYDIVMSFPVKTSTVVASRLAILYILNQFFIVIVMVPCYVAYAVIGKPNAMFVIGAIISLPVLPMIPMVLSSVIGTLIALISVRFKRSNLVSLLLMIALFVVLMVGSFSIQTEEQMIELGKTINDLIQQTYPPAMWLLNGVCRQDVMSLLLFICVSLAMFAAFCLVVGKWFTKMNDLVMSIHTHARFVLKKQKKSSKAAAIIKKDFGRLFSSTNYMMNSSVGQLMMVVAAVAVFFVSDEKLQTVLTQLPIKSVTSLAAGLMIMCTSMTTISACSISIEGKNLWILKSSPISGDVIFRGKWLLNLFVCLPFIVVSGILFFVRFGTKPEDLITLLVLPLITAWFFSVFGLAVNARFPILDWKNELAVVKQSAAVLIMVFGSFLFGGVTIALLLLSPLPSLATVLIVCAIFATAAFILQRSIERRADKILSNLV